MADIDAYSQTDNSFGSKLLSQQKHVRHLLKQTLVDLEDATEKRIQAYQKDQELLLSKEKEKVRYEGVILWQTMKEAFHANRKEKQRVRHSVNKNSSDQIIFDRIMLDDHVQDVPQDALEETMSKDESLVQDHDVLFDKNYIQQRRRSSAFTRDLFGELTPTSHDRRSSHVLDESLLANSFEKNKTENELPPFQRRSSLIPHQLHPLAAASTHNTETNMTLPTISSNTSSWDEHKEAHQEDMFALDEDIDQTEIRIFKERKPSEKYIELFDDDEPNGSKQINMSMNSANSI